jgi:copper resistance protein B
MSYGEMAKMMEMDDTARIATLLIDQGEWRTSDGESELVWDGKASWGGDVNKLLLKTEGERVGGQTQDARVDLLWDRVISRWWSFQAGARQDFGEGPSRTWAALGVEGKSPLWFDVEATLYAGEQGRTAARIKLEHDLLMTQRLILQPELEAHAYGKSDPERRIGSGLSDIDVGLRLRYEIKRELAPYVGIAWRKSFGRTADLVRADGEDESNLQLLAGIRVWL